MESGMQEGKRSRNRRCRRRKLPGGDAFRAGMNLIDDASAQLRAVHDYFGDLASRHEWLPGVAAAPANDPITALAA